jgi:TatD DNase family protein
MIDVHCHVETEENIPEDVSIITVGTTVESSLNAVKLAEKHKNVWACVGVHPEEISNLKFEILNQLRELTKHKKVVGVGEIGLDYRLETSEELKERQRMLFRQMLELARETSLPVQVHNRNADEDILKALDDYRDLKVLMHCFTRGREFMKVCVERGWYMSFGGFLAKSSNSRMKAIVQEVPEELLLLETDAPYGGTSVKIVAEYVANLRRTSIDEVEKITTKNTERLFSMRLL